MGGLRILIVFICNKRDSFPKVDSTLMRLPIILMIFKLTQT